MGLVKCKRETVFQQIKGGSAMSDLTKEQYEQLPDFIKGDYVEVDGVYRHGGFVKVKSTADNLDKNLNGERSQREQLEQQLRELQEQEQQRIEAARREAYEKARQEGNLDHVEKQWKEKLADANRRADETVKQYEERMKRLSQRQRNALATEIASKHAITGGEEALKRLLLSYISIDAETDQETYLDDSGSATSLDRNAFEAEIKNNPLFARLIKADVATSGGGNVNGSKVGSATKRPEDYTEQERVQLFKQNPAEFKRLFNGA